MMAMSPNLAAGFSFHITFHRGHVRIAVDHVTSGFPTVSGVWAYLYIPKGMGLPQGEKPQQAIRAAAVAG